jgi:hypothetical protein
MKYILFYFFIFCLYSNFSYSQNWNKSIAGSEGTVCKNIDQANDSSLLFSYLRLPGTSHFSKVIRTDQAGNNINELVFDSAQFMAVKATADNGLLIGGNYFQYPFNDAKRKRDALHSKNKQLRRGGMEYVYSCRFRILFCQEN